MAKLYHTNGTPYRFAKTIEEEERGVTGPTFVEFDETVNPAVAQQIADAPLAYRVVGTEIRRDGTPVGIAADSPGWTARRELRQQVTDRLAEVAQVVTDADTCIATVDASTNAQLRTLVKTQARGTKDIAQIVRRILRTLK